MLNLIQTAPRKCWSVGHRGASGRAPENTMASFMTALRMGADLAECDVHVSKDGKCVVMHDESLERTTNRNGLIRDLKSSQIRLADAGSWAAKKFSDEKVPMLSDLLIWAKNSVSRQGLPFGLVIEIKNDPVRYFEIEKKVAREVLGHGMEERVILISFDHGVVKRAKLFCKKIATGILYDRPLADPVRRAKDVKADAIFPRRNFIAQKLARAAHEAGLAVGTWTVNEVPEMKKILACGVDAVTTNYPDVLNRILEGKNNVTIKK